MRIGLIGFGRTGKVIAEEILKEPACTLEWVLKRSDDLAGKYASDLLGMDTLIGQIYSMNQLNNDSFFQQNPVDVIIDFSSPDSIFHYSAAAELGIKVVSAISNYEDKHYAELIRMSQSAAVLYSPNITLGINFLMEASRLFKQLAPHADVEIVEEHFRGKKDVSGTALRIAKSLGLDEKEHVNSIRIGDVVGRHEIIFGLPNQTIRLVHETFNRAAFGQGALYAARWLLGQPNGLYSMEDVLGFGAGRQDSGKPPQPRSMPLPILPAL
ncbi:4-hydroxy-tetrahydrodipicolinate reductase [Effusibacillus lacus]|uniref:4-hydroxy-tetrahydrodipicolinate reductase n=1 Tax=Effusibacillus lacus TaxID=1348429 RepID=A0A292YDH8_9BACL|nr:dihydrodipicolinate reductase C-terminal domain-containing protein [Effusibacillus lacus]TCS68277.1 4-hydroxy-tetrahydrodipicolinate reductase [Effusibacillus lacus]GAX90172.1 dihydrodipicolinate reductase [Effusibacillus lacus]